MTKEKLAELQAEMRWRMKIERKKQLSMNSRRQITNRVKPCQPAKS